MLKDMEWRRRTTLGTDKAKETIITNTKDISMVLLPPLKRKRQLKLQSIQMLSQFLKPRKKLHTAHSWNFVLLEKNRVIRPSSLWKKARCGEDAITTNFDTVANYMMSGETHTTDYPDVNGNGPVDNYGYAEQRLQQVLNPRISWRILHRTV